MSKRIFQIYNKFSLKTLMF